MKGRLLKATTETKPIAARFGKAGSSFAKWNPVPSFIK